MAHFAELNEEAIVIQVVVVRDDELRDADGSENEHLGLTFLNRVMGGGHWVQTSYNANFRKSYAGVGFSYDSERDAFIPPKPYDSWILNEGTCKWEPPIPMPDDGNVHRWDESTEEWE